MDSKLSNEYICMYNLHYWNSYAFQCMANLLSWYCYVGPESSIVQGLLWPEIVPQRSLLMVPVPLSQSKQYFSWFLSPCLNLNNTSHGSCPPVLT